MNVGDIIKNRRKFLRLSQGQLGDKVGISQQHIQRYEKGYPVPLNKVNLIADALQIDACLLIPQDVIPAHSTGINNVAEKITSLFIKKDEVTIDMIDATACCGDGVEALSEKVCGHWKLPTAEFNSITTGNPNNIKMLRVQGDSMQPTINDGDWVWVDISNNFISSDGMYLIKMHTGLAVKRLQSGLNNIKIKSDNPTYSDITADIGEINIIGKVVYILNGRRV
jgi:transcriptional regulator with XRE-family HTH domain